MESESLHLKMRDKISEIVAFVNGFLNKGQDRSVKAKKNIIASFFIKGISLYFSYFQEHLSR